MKLKGITEILRINLQKELPGLNAQKKMAPDGRINGNYNSNPKYAKKSAVLILLYQTCDKVYFPVIQKTMYEGVHSGQISFPGGQYEFEDKTLNITAVREAEEEIGVNSKDVEVLGKLTDLFIPVSNFIVTPYVGVIYKKPIFNVNPSEVDKIFEVEISELISPKILNEKIQINGSEIIAPYYIFNKVKIWGATAMVLSEFSDLLTT